MTAYTPRLLNQPLRLSEEEKRAVQDKVLRGIPRPLAVAMVRKVFKGPYG